MKRKIQKEKEEKKLETLTFTPNINTDHNRSKSFTGGMKGQQETFQKRNEEWLKKKEQRKENLRKEKLVKEEEEMKKGVGVQAYHRKRKSITGIRRAQRLNKDLKKTAPIDNSYLEGSPERPKNQSLNNISVTSQGSRMSSIQRQRKERSHKRKNMLYNVRLLNLLNFR